MRRFVRPIGVALGLFAILASCNSDRPLAPKTGAFAKVSGARANATMPDVRISEIHYDNASNDVLEQVEISGPAGFSVAGWKVVPYNGSNGQQYSPITTLSGTIPATCGARGVIAVSISGFQNGSPDGVALVDAANNVVEFLSYEGVFTATDGPALGKLSTDIGVAQLGNASEPAAPPSAVRSLQRNGSNVWSGPTPNTFVGVVTDPAAACNDLLAPGTPVARVEITQTEATILAGQTFGFTAKAFDATDNEIIGAALTWSAEPASIASVNANGVATGLDAGDATITVSGQNGTATTTATATLHVNELPPLPPSDVNITEIHYDNTGADVGEALEIEGPAGFDLTGWTVVLYNGSGGASYATLALPATIPANCANGRGVVTVNGPGSGIQNGAPDGLALVNGADQVVELLSYEGTFRASNGVAVNRKAADIGVSEAGTEPAGLSLQRESGGMWDGPIASTMGACNVTPAQSAATIVINEIMADPLKANGGSSWGEWFEVHNYGASPVDMQGWAISSSGQPSHTIATSLVVPAGGFAVLGRGADVSLNGGLTIDYNYFVGSATIFLDDADRLELRDAAGARVDLVRWTSMPLGVTRGVRDATADNVDVSGANWGFSAVAFGDGDFGTPGAANGTLSATPPIIPNFITVTGRLPGDAPLPVGYEDQIFPTLRNGSGAAIPTTFTWSSETPTIASIHAATGVIKALAAGTARFRATAAEGTTRVWTLPTHVATESGVQYPGNAEFGEPADGNPSDDFIVRHAQFTASYSNVRNTSNWVSYNLDGAHIGAFDRCDCFTFDESLPASFTRYNTADYTNSSDFADINIARGHLARSFDRTTGSLDNARTFLFTNIVPQASDMNSGPWGAFESFLGDKARFENKEVYIVTGVAGSKGTLKNLGVVTIPASMWKVAVVMDHDEGLGDVHDYRDVEVFAVIMPNTETGLLAWPSYQVTVDAVEALSGYDLLALLPDNIETAVESNTFPPIAKLDGPYSGVEGSAIAMSAATSVDPNGSIASYAWTFGDGGTAGGASASHTYANNGTYTVTLTVTDNDGLVDQTTTTVNVANVAPTIAPFAGATLLPGEQYTATGSFTDPGADAWTASVLYGDGSPESALALTGMTFALSHTYLAPGTFTVRVRIDDGSCGVAATQTVVVWTHAQGVAKIILPLVNQLPDKRAKPLKLTLLVAIGLFEHGKTKAAVAVLKAFLFEVEALARARKIDATTAAALRAAANRVIASAT